MVGIFGHLEVLPIPPRKDTASEHLKYRVHCNAPGCTHEDKWMRADHIKTATSCGCQKGKKRDDPGLAGLRLGFVVVLKGTRVNGKRTECLVRCVVCGETKWVRAEQLRYHVGIGCKHCMPRLNNITAGKYHVLGGERRNEERLPETLCETEDGKQIWVSKEKVLRRLADQLSKTANRRIL